MTPRARCALGVLPAVILAAAACARQADAPPDPAQPATRVSTVSETIHGIRIEDHYRWLESDTPDVVAWTGAQTRYTRAVLDRLPGRKALEDRLKPLVQIGSVTAPIVRGNRYFYARRTATQEQPVIFLREGALGGERTLVDPAAPGAAGTAPVSWIAPSADGSRLAYGLAQGGTGVATLRLFDVDRATLLPDEIPNVLEGIQWLPDGSGFVYDCLRDASDPGSRQGLFHTLGRPPSSDVILYRHVTRAENPSMARTGGPAGALSRDGRWFLLSYWISPERNDLWLATFDEFRRQGARAARAVSIGAPGVAQGTVIGDTLFLHTTKGAPRGRVVAASTAAPDEKHWREIVPERAEVIEAVAFAQGTIAVTYLRSASTAIEVFDFDGRSRGTLALPGVGTASLTTAADRTEAYLSFSSFNYPPTAFRVDLATPQSAPKYWTGPDVPIDPAGVEVRQVTYASRDGTPVTMFLVHRKGLALDGAIPTLLSAYGAFGMRMVPAFSPPLLQWFEAGGALAVANVRGGGEYGAAWHDAGKLAAKQRGIEDLIAGAEWLIANRYTQPRVLALHGAANGGLLAAAALTMRPELFRAAVLADPVADMLRYHKFASDPYWVAEYGSADSAEQFNWLRAYSPYQQVRSGTTYPAILLTTAEASGIPALHARKMAAALQNATGAGRPPHPILFSAERDGAATFDAELRGIVDERLFLMWQLGMLDARGNLKGGP